jgi:hypothetical protein
MDYTKVSSHAINRYIERVKPAIEASAAKQEILALASAQTSTDDPPSWCNSKTRTTADSEYIQISDDIVFAVSDKNQTVITVLVRGGHHDKYHQAKRKYKKNRRQAKAARRNKNLDASAKRQARMRVNEFC